MPSTVPVPPLPSPAAQAEALVTLGVHELVGLTARSLRSVAASSPPGSLLVSGARASALAPLMRRGDRAGLVVVDMVDVDDFGPTPEAVAPPVPSVVEGTDRGDEFAARTPAEVLPELLAAGRSPLTVEEGLHWVLVQPEVLERGHCGPEPPEKG